MKISVVIPIYNVEDYVENCIESVLGQTEQDFEIIAVNDASTDGSWDKVRKMAHEDGRIVLLENERNMGLAATRNVGLKAAKGKYVYFLDSDDMIKSDALGTLYERAEKESLDIQIFAAEFIYETEDLREKFSGNPRIFKGSYPDVLDGRTLLKKWMEVWDWLPSQPRYFYRRDFLIDNDLTYKVGMVHEDEVFSMNAIMKADRIRVSNDEFFIRRFRPSSIMTGNVTEGSIEGCRLILENTEGYVDSSEDEELRKALRFYMHKIEKNMQGKLEGLYKSTDEIVNVFDDESISVVSFDVFDTLFVRPTERPDDVYRLLDKRFRELMKDAPDFYIIRTEAEAVLRRFVIDNPGKVPEDFDISKIYRTMNETLKIPAEICSEMINAELALEKKLLSVRETGKYLLLKAHEKGKRVIVTSDMYMTKDFIRELLSDNGMDVVSEIYISSEVGKRKISSSLYRHVISAEGVSPENIFHIGDNSEADCLIPAKLGMRTAYLPNTMDAYNRCEIDREVKRLCGGFINYEAACTSPGFRAIKKLAANKYFDDPYREFDPESVYNNDPYFCGYAALGPEVLSLTKWLRDNVKRDRVKKIVFLSRDGYLPKQAYDFLNKGDYPESDYICVSRLSLLPAIINSPYDLYELPVDKSYQTPRKLLRLLEFCVNKEKCNLALQTLESVYGIAPDENFTNRSFNEFVRYIIGNLYDEEVHRQHKDRIAKYLKDRIDDECAIFDMGYSGRIAAAIAKAAEVRPKVYFFHSDSGGHFRYEEMAGIEIRSFLDFNPHMESSLREYSYLEVGPSCIGYDENEMPLFDIGPAPGYERTVLPQQKGAMDFVRDFTEYFAGYEKQAGFRYLEASLFFEAFIRYASEADKAMYDGILIDDELWGGRRDIDLKDLMEIRLRKIPNYAK